jgi:hypothetical protein
LIDAGTLLVAAFGSGTVEHKLKEARQARSEGRVKVGAGRHASRYTMHLAFGSHDPFGMGKA